ncbi:hypothetical protein [Amycolatopsis nivea]|uniref:hypothetical protein n=1 Tax=Amycolatopsis nivea TaxID=1644109 RepID=UPI00106F9682|nr:hypothetical protein [Amycolatopsis nivea]
MKRTVARILLPLAAAGAFAGFGGGAASAATPDASAPAQPAVAAGQAAVPGSSVPGLPAGLPSPPTGGLPSLPTGGLPTPSLPGAPTGGSPSIWVVPGLDAGSLLGPTTQAPAQLLAPVFNLVTAVS